MGHNRTRQRGWALRLAGSSICALAAVWASPAAAEPTNVTLTTSRPRLLEVSTTIPGPLGTGEIHAYLKYEFDGTIGCHPFSTLDGEAASCTASVFQIDRVWRYKVDLRTPPEGATTATASIAGRLRSEQARCIYSGPRGNQTVKSLVTVVSRTPVGVLVGIDPFFNDQGTVDGIGRIVSDYENDPPGEPLFEGSIVGKKLTWTLTHAARRVTFSGRLSGGRFCGTLEASIPPLKGKRDNICVNPPYATPPARFSVRVTESAGSSPDPAFGATVWIRSDLNGDGTLGVGEGTTLLGGNGLFDTRPSAGFPVRAGVPVSVTVEHFGYAPGVVHYESVLPGSVVTSHVHLVNDVQMLLNDGEAFLTDGTLALDGLPAEVVGVRGRRFNPATESSQFPGEFEDSQENVLVSSVFASIDARDTGGMKVSSLGGSTIFKMLVPVDTLWTLRDLTAGNGRIDVPLYYMDEDTGEWIRSAANGWLEDGEGGQIAESALASIRERSYGGSVYAAGSVTRLSTWGVAWPIESHACLHGTVVLPGVGPIRSAVISASGLSYDGASGPVITGPDGTFCLDLMKSELGGEDVDGDGVNGETQSTRLIVAFGTDKYEFTPMVSPTSEAGCGAGGCGELGELTLDAGHKLETSLCTVSGTILYSGSVTGGTSNHAPGDPIESAIVTGFDPRAIEFREGCIEDGPCPWSSTATTAQDGTFTLTTPVLSGLTLLGGKVESPQSGKTITYSATLTLVDCPAQSVSLPLDAYVTKYVSVDLYDDQAVFAGRLHVEASSAAFTLVAGGDYYSSYQAGPISPVPPTGLGHWLTLDLNRLIDEEMDDYERVGSIEFTVTGLSPLSGTWAADDSGTPLSGTWSEVVLVGAAGDPPGPARPARPPVGTAGLHGQ